MKKGFTLIEVLVASLLLGMLVSMLTSVFSQTSIAWSIGTAAVVDLDKSRSDISKYQSESDSLLGGDGSVSKSVFSGFRGTDLNLRAVARGDAGLASVFNTPTAWSGLSAGGAQSESGRVGLGDGKVYSVGVTSWGPDGEKNTWDDITTWPNEEE